jgi:ubiquinone/menaquinone biosynthesis C-methylase UbiE
MGNTSFDPAAFKAQQREQWSNVAQGWRRRWEAFERGGQPLSDRLMELAHVELGKRVLDVATGIGEPAMTAARRVGPDGSVVAVDQAPEMLTVARERMQADGIHNIDFIEGDAEAVTLPDESFDAVVCRWGLMLFGDPVGTLGRLRTALVPGGWLAAAVWGQPERVPLIALPFAVLRRELGEQSRPAAGPNPFALSEPTALEQVARDAGFAEVRSEPFTVTFMFAATEELLGYLSDVSAPLRAAMAAQSLERQAVLREKLAEAAAVFADAEGRIRMPNDCVIVAGRR